MLAALRASLSLLATRRFGTFWFASLLSSIGTWTQQVAEPWLLLAIGASPFLIGLDSFAMNAPLLLLTLAGGALADRHDRRRVITLFQSIQMLCPIAIVALLITGQIQPWMIIACAVVVGITDALSMPSFQSIVPAIVPRDQIDRGLALNATQFNLSRVIGPSIAGILMSSFGAMACFTVSALSYVPFIGVAIWILPRWVPAPGHGDAARRSHMRADIGEILHQRRLRGALLTVLTTSLFCAPLVTFTPILVKEVFNGDAARFSMTIASFGVGGLLGSIALLAIPVNVDRRRLSMGFALCYGTILVLIALNPWYWSLLLLVLLAGISMTICGTAANSLLQATVTPRLLGQTVSLHMLAMRGGFSLGALLTGVLVGAVGVQHALLLNGLLTVVILVTMMPWWFRAPPPLAQAK